MADASLFPGDADARLARATPSLIAGLKAPAAMKVILLAVLNVRGGRLLVGLPNGQVLEFGEPSAQSATIHIRDMTFAKMVMSGGDIGFAESYIAGHWDTPDLSGLLTLLSANIEMVIQIYRGNPLVRIVHSLQHLRRENTRSGARKNILAHYDLGNRFYAKWLDETMTYSAARFDGPQPAALSDAQLAKYRAIARHIDLKPGEHVLEIGCGWGGFAEVAAKEFGARVTGLTLSNEQHAFASERMQRLGVNDRVDIRIEDYRDVAGAFDKVASIEMFEAVGEKYWPAFFGKLADVLKPGGRAGLQIITIRDDLFEDYRKHVDFIQRYVFPGGMLPSLARLRSETQNVGLQACDIDTFGLCYAETLAHWGRRFRDAWSDITTLGFDERFRRLWQFYLSYCEAGFRTGRTDVVQLALAKPS